VKFGVDVVLECSSNSCCLNPSLSDINVTDAHSREADDEDMFFCTYIMPSSSTTSLTFMKVISDVRLYACKKRRVEVEQILLCDWGWPSYCSIIMYTED
jgi:hypothetical protein